MVIGNILDQDFEEKLRTTQQAGTKDGDKRTPLPKVPKQTRFTSTKRGSKKPGTPEKLEPLKEIIINNKPKDIEFLHYKEKNKVGPAKFYNTMKETTVDAQTKQNNLMKKKISQTENAIMKLRSGKDDTPFVDTFLNTKRSSVN